MTMRFWMPKLPCSAEGALLSRDGIPHFVQRRVTHTTIDASLSDMVMQARCACTRAPKHMFPIPWQAVPCKLYAGMALSLKPHSYAMRPPQRTIDAVIDCCRCACACESLYHILIAGDAGPYL